MKALIVGVLVASLVLAACGEPDPVYEHAYNVDGFIVHSEAPLKESSVRYNIQLARRLLVPNVMTAGEFEDLRSVPIYVRRSNEWSDKTGNYDATFGISLGGNMQRLVHELLHAWEARSLVLDSFRHPEWESKGYYALDDAFASMNLNPLYL